MKKRNKSRILSLWLLMSMLFGVSWSSWAASSDVITSVTCQGNVFTITRSDASLPTYVNYRTLDGSAVGGVHFEHQSGRINFAVGEKQKTITVTLKDAGGINVYSTGENVQRKFGLVAWNDFSENHYAEASIKCSAFRENIQTSCSVIAFPGSFYVTDGGLVYKNFNLETCNRDVIVNQIKYLKATGQTWKWMFKLDCQTVEVYDGYYYLGLSMTGNYKAFSGGSDSGETFSIGSNLYGVCFDNNNKDIAYLDVPVTNTSQKLNTTVKKYAAAAKAQDGDYIVCNTSNSYTIYTTWGATGASDDKYQVVNANLYVKMKDAQAPSLKAVSCNTQSAYSHGDKISVALQFDEIVKIATGATLETNVGTLTYAGGSGTSTLYFQTTLSYNVDAKTLSIKSVDKEISDLSGNKVASVSKENTNFRYVGSRPTSLNVSADIWNKKMELTWSGSVDANTNGSWDIYRYLTEYGPATAALVKTIDKSNDNYSDVSAKLLYDRNYTYMIQFVPSTATDADKIIGRRKTASESMNRKFEIVMDGSSEDDRINLNWSSTSFRDGKSHTFEIYRRTGANKDSIQIASVSSSTTSYIDKDVVGGCSSYTYYIVTSGLFADDSIVDGVSYVSNRFVGALLGSSKVLSVNATKGTYPSTVKLTWNASQKGSQPTKYTVYRKDINATDGWINIYSTSGVSTIYSYDDNTARPGNYYQYKVASSYYCEALDADSDPVEVMDDGFCRNLGIVSGSISYGTGTAVPDVKVSLIKNSDDQTSSQYYALKVNQESGIRLPLTVSKDSSYFAQKPWTIQLYVNPSDQIFGTGQSSSEKSMLVESYNNFGLYLIPVDNTHYYIGMEGPNDKDSVTYYNTKIKISANEYSHLTFSSNGNGSLTVRKTDTLGNIKKSSHKFATKFYNAENDSVATSDLLFGYSFDANKYFKGYLDEIRVFSGKEMTDNEVKKTYNRILTGSESNMVVYWPLDEGITSQRTAYDYSITSELPNENHGEIRIGSEITSKYIPSRNQLDAFAYTDQYGNYTIDGVPFSGRGTTYMVTPTYGIHKFSPTYATRFVSNNSLVHSGVDFEDVSSFPTKGVVYYTNTDYPVEDAYIYVDGTICSKDGNMITTDANGQFEISVPIGDHHIQVKKNGHVFVNNGRYPSNELDEHRFESVLDKPLRFYDSTFVTLTGRVSGGKPESEKQHGFGLGKATIGAATIQLSAGSNYQLNLDPLSGHTFSCPSDSIHSVSTTGKYNDDGNAKVITIHTDSVTGEFAVSVPPIDLQVISAVVNNNSEIGFKVENIENILLGTGSLQDQTDSLVIAPGDTATFTYKYALDLIYRSEPVLELTSLSTRDGAFGDQFYVYQDKASLAYDTIPLYSLDSITGDIRYTFGYPIFTQGNKYTHNLYLYEPYMNNDGDSAVVTKIPLTGAEVSVANNMGATMVAIEDGVDEEGNEVKDGDVVTSGNSSLVVDSLGSVSYIFKATYPNIVEPYTLGMNINYVYDDKTYAWSENGQFSGIVTGGLETGSNFITAGPDKVLFVLRDPPGTGSSAYIEKGQTITTSSKVTTEYNSEYKAELTWKIGATFATSSGFGFAVITEDKNIADLSAGTEISYDSSHERENSYTITTTDVVSTSDNGSYVGADGDVFIGSATNIIVGKARKVAIVKDSLDNYSLGMFDAISVGNNLTTQFKYTQNYIENVLIPNLEETRNSYLTTVLKSEYNKGYKNQSGKTLYITTKNASDDDYGYPDTYICIPNDTAKFVDTVGYFNTQISLWQTELALNEAAKVKAINSTLDYNESEYNAALKKFEEAQMLENTSYLLYDPYTQHYVKLDSTFWFNKEGGVIKYADYGTNWSMINNILEGYSINRSEYEKYLSTPSAERDFTLFYDTTKYGWKVNNTSFDSGTSVEESVQRCSSSSASDATSTKGLFVANLKSGFSICDFGFEFEVETKQGGTEGFEASQSTENCTTIGYTLAEEGDDEALTVDVFQAPDGFGPIFYTRAGQTSCPYEYERRTKYFEPDKHVISQATMQIEMPKIYVGDNNAKSQQLVDVPSGSAANFSLKLNNLSEINEDLWMIMYMVDETNPYGAALSIDGVPFATSRSVLVNALQTTTKNLQIKQTRSDIMKYDSIAVVLASACQNDGTDIGFVIADTIYLSVEFVPSCSPVTLDIDNRTMNSSTGTDLQMMVKDYEKDYLGFNEIRIQYKGERDNDWRLAQKLSVDELKGSSELVTFPMGSTLFNDQTYQFRAQSVCANGAASTITRESEVINLVKDLARPQVLGNPNPADGILDAGDEISVTYNEDIRSGMLSKADNFVIEAVLNDAEVDHNVALKLDSTSSYAAATEAPIVLANKSFTVDMWVNLSSGGTLLYQASAKDTLSISVGSTGKLTAKFNSTKVTSTEKIPFNKWCFLTLCYTAGEESSLLNALVAYDAEEKQLLYDQKVPTYGGTGTLSLGKRIRGAIGEVALWNTNRSNTESQAQMYFSKSASTENLIGYWKFDEGHGKVARDAARSRNMALSADNWYLNNTNYAATLDGKSHLSLDISRSVALTSDDYMVEMWFRGASQKNATLWSANSTVALKFNASGYLTLVADSVATQLSTNNYLDNAWHHVALNVLRNGTTSIYVDGALAKQISSSKVPALQASELTVGAQRYSDNDGQSFNYSNFFKGDVDEIRYWVATFNAKAIDQFRYMRLNGDEAGLEAYYPFEETVTDAGISSLAFAMNDMSANAVGKATGSAKKASSAPALQAKPKMSKLDYSFVASERTIAITLNESASRLEGTTVNFTVMNVRDENNNYSLPVTWSAYINQNRLIWADAEIALEKSNEEWSDFEVAISNQGASTESWSISNLPIWLTASKTSGSLSAQKSETIHFEISDAVPAGTYEETLYLMGNEGIKVPFALNLKVNTGKPNWSVDPSKFENSMSVLAQLKLDGAFSADEEDLVAAFVNGVCVGIASPKYYSRYDGYYVTLDVYGNSDSEGKKVTFKAWDTSTGVVYPSLTSTPVVSYSSNALFGSMTEAVVLESNKYQEQQLNLKSGWNWISLNVTPSDNKINAVLGDVAAEANLAKSKSKSSLSDGSQFVGELKTLSPGYMYKLSMNESSELNVVGSALDASKATVTIKKGWNWIGYNGTANISLEEAFAGLTPVDGDMVKGQSGFALYQGYEWVGSLTALNPGKGYMYKSVASEARTFTYPAKSASLKALVSKEETKTKTYTAVDDTKYSGNMTIVARVMNGHTVVEEAEVGVFVAKECRAAAAVSDNSLVFLTVAGDNSSDALTIKVIYAGEEYVIDPEMTYSEDATLGSLSNPYIIQLDPVNSVDETLASDIQVYPTLVEEELNVVSSSAVVLSYQLTDIAGRVMAESAVNANSAVINVSGLNAGAYLLVLQTSEGQLVKRFTKK